MASKVPQNADNVVNERRLRPIYDRLDNGNNKKALQEADKVLKKHPSNQCARVLKALALLRLGKEDECQSIIDKVRAEVPCEDYTLQAMSICYREIHQPDKISEVYEAASKADPNNEELLTHLFMSYVRLGDYKKQHHTALALYKLVPKNPYYFWAVMSIVMQASQAEDKQAKNVILPLAERMVLKLIKEGKIEAEQEIQLYLMILEMQGKTEEMFEIISGPLAPKLSNVTQRKAKLLLQMKRFDEAAKAYEELIRKERDNWAYYQEYLTAGLNCQTATKCYKFLNETITTTFDDKVRAPQLARLELLKRTSEQKLEIEHCAHICDDMRQYFKQFGNKGCIVGDLKLYLHLLSDADKEELLENIEIDIGVGENDYPTTVDQMQRHIHFEQLKRICGRHHPPRADVEERKNLVKRLSDLYDKGNALCPRETRLATDFCPADSYILLAVHILYQLWYETSDATWLYKAMNILERGLLSSRANFHLKILLIRIYLEAGVTVGANFAYSMLDCKHIQLDSLGHLYAPLLAPLGYLSQASYCLDHAAKFFIANYKDSADHLTYAYKFGSFLKIQEFVELRERLENSIHFAMTTVDKMLLEMSWCDSPMAVTNSLSSMHIQPAEDSIRWDLLRDNRDVDVVVGWEPLPENNEDLRMKLETRECMVRLLAARSLMLRILAAANDADSSSLLARLSGELKKLQSEVIPQLLQKFKRDGKDRVNSVIVPLDAVERLREAYSSEQLSLIAQFADSLANSSCPDSECIEALRTSPCLKPLPLPEQNKPVSYRKFLFRASTCGETLAFLSALEKITKAIQNEILQSQTLHENAKLYYSKKLKTITSNIIKGDWNQSFVSNYYGDFKLTGNYYTDILNYKKIITSKRLRNLRNSPEVTEEGVPFSVNELFNIRNYLVIWLYTFGYKHDDALLNQLLNISNELLFSTYGVKLAGFMYTLMTNDLLNNVLSYEPVPLINIVENNIFRCFSREISNRKMKMSDDPFLYIINNGTEKYYFKIDDIVENFAIRVAYKAMHDENCVSSSESICNTITKELGITSEKLFFLAYIKSNCNRSESLAKIDNTLKDLEDFLTVFECPKNPQMSRNYKKQICNSTLFDINDGIFNHA